jgi:excinuclease UvrABC ATPase subunit
MDTVESTCERCGGSGFSDEAQRHRVEGRSIADVMALTVEEASDALGADVAMRAALRRLIDVGLAYMRLGQSLDTLSGGERQRLKLAVELQEGNGVLVLDEPTTGLHMADIEGLLGLMDRLVDAGRTLIVIEHNLDVVLHADWVIDLGPGAGDRGGRVVFEGTVSELIRAPASLTGAFLARFMRSCTPLRSPGTIESG